MGNESQKQLHQSNDTNSSTNTLGNNHHPKLAKAKIINGISHSYLQLEAKVLSKELFHKWKENVIKYSQYQGIDTLYLPTKMQFKQNTLCGTAGFATLQYQILPFILHQEIQNRRQINQPFLEKQIWYLLYSLSYTGFLVHSNDSLIGDVRPENILIGEQGNIKVATLCTFNDEHTNYIKALTTKQISLLAPQQLKDLENRNQIPTFSPFMSECFSIGMTILSAILLTDMSYLYNRKLSFKIGEFRNKIQGLQSLESYSILLRKIVQGMCKKDPSKRLSCSEVVQILHPVHHQLLNLQDFTLNYIPNDLKTKLSLYSNYQSKGPYPQQSNLTNFPQRISYQEPFQPTGSKKSLRNSLGTQNMVSSNSVLTSSLKIYNPRNQHFYVVQNSQSKKSLNQLSMSSSYNGTSSHEPSLSSYNFSKQRSATVSYGQKKQFYLLDRQQNKMKLEFMGRETKSIHPETNFMIESGKNDEDILKRAEQRITQSQLRFPNYK